MVKSIISQDIIYHRVRSIRPNLYFTVDIKSFYFTDLTNFINRIQDIDLPLKLTQIYKPLDKIEIVTINSKKLYIKPYYVISNVNNIDTDNITITYIDDINLSITNTLFQDYNFNTLSNNTINFILFNSLIITYYSQDTNTKVQTFNFTNLTPQSIEFDLSFDKTSTEYNIVSLSLSFTEFLFS